MGAGRWPTGMAPIDSLLDGGLETDSLTEIYGEAGSAKTIFCLAATVRAAREGRWTFYIDTEGVSVDRLSSSAQGDLEPVLDHLLLASPRNLGEQEHAVATACALARQRTRSLGLIVLDSATHYYRVARSDEDEEEARRALAIQVADLVALALELEVPVVLTNQVWTNVRNGVLEPLGGTFLSHAAKTILRFERLAGARRRAVLMKHRSLPGASAEFRITATGLA